MVKGEKNKTHSVLLSLAVLLLFVPMALSYIPFTVRKVNGEHYEVRPKLDSVSLWFDGNYQAEMNNYLEKRPGFYDLMVRSYNELDYILYKKAHARFVVIGKENYLYESGYIDAYQGLDFVGERELIRKAKLVRLLQQKLLAEGKLLLPVIAPGKASFYPGYFPPRYERAITKRNNYEAFVSSLNAEGAKYIDFRKYFLDWKNTSVYPLYPKGGIHWSNYASTICFDSIVKYCSAMLGQDPPSVCIDTVQWSSSLREPDNDIATGLNIFSQLQDEKLAYPVYHIANPGNQKFKVITIADSFWWYIFSSGMPSACFAKNEFWYYNEEIFPARPEGSSNVRNTDYFKSLRNADIILVLYNESNLNRFSDGLLEMCDDVFLKQAIRKQKFQELKEQICTNREWFSEVQKKAAERDVTVDSMLTLDALYLLDK